MRNWTAIASRANALHALLAEAAHLLQPLTPMIALTRGTETSFLTPLAEHRVDWELPQATGEALTASANLTLGAPPGGWHVEGPWVVGEETLWVMAARPDAGPPADHVHHVLHLTGLWAREALQARATAAAMAAELEDLQAISRIASITTSGLNLEDVLQDVIETVGAIIGADSAGCLLYEEETDELVLQKPAFGFSDEQHIGVYRVPVTGHSNAARVFRSGQPYMTNQAMRDPRLVRRLVEAYPAGSILSVPLQVGQKRIGVLHVNGSQEGAFTQRHLRLLQLVAPQLAVNIRNAQLYKLLKDQHGKLARAQEIASVLTRAVLSGALVDEIARNLAALLHNTVLIFDPQGALITTGVPDGCAGEVDAGLVARVQSLLDAQAAEPVERRLEGPARGAPVAVLMVPIASGRNLWGYLAVVGTHGWSGSDRMAVQQAALVFALEFLRQQTAAEVERKLKGDFVLELVEGAVPLTKENLRRAAQLGCDLSRPHRVLALALDPADGEADPVGPGGPDGPDGPEGSSIQAVYRCVTDHLPAGSLAGIQRGRVVLLMPAAGAAAPEAKEPGGAPASGGQSGGLAVVLQQRVKEVVGRSVSVGVGRRAMAGELHRSAADANHCLQTIWAFGSQGRVLDYEELGVASLLLRTADKAELVHFCQRTLGPLAERSEYHRQLRETLWCYLLCLDRQQVARRMHVHLNTVKYRLQRVQALTGSNLSRPDHLQRLQMAMQIFRLLCSNRLPPAVETSLP